VPFQFTDATVKTFDKVSEFDNAVVKVIHTCKDAAEAAGVHYDTFNEWMKAGKEATRGRLFEFSEAVQAANAQCAVNFTRVIQTAAAKGDAKYALEWLKRRRRAEWGDNVDVTTGNEKITAIRIIKASDDHSNDND